MLHVFSINRVKLIGMQIAATLLDATTRLNCCERKTLFRLKKQAEQAKLVLKFGLFFQPEQCFSLTTIQPE